MGFKYWGFLLVGLIISAVVIVPHIRTQLSENGSSRSGGLGAPQKKMISVLPPTKTELELQSANERMAMILKSVGQGQQVFDSKRNKSALPKSLEPSISLKARRELSDARIKIRKLEQQLKQQRFWEGLTLERTAAYLGILSFVMQIMIWTWGGLSYMRRPN